MLQAFAARDTERRLRRVSWDLKVNDDMYSEGISLLQNTRTMG